MIGYLGRGEGGGSENEVGWVGRRWGSEGGWGEGGGGKEEEVRGRQGGEEVKGG